MSDLDLSDLEDLQLGPKSHSEQMLEHDEALELEWLEISNATYAAPSQEQAEDRVKRLPPDPDPPGRTTPVNKAAVRALNDRFRRGDRSVPGQRVMTRAVYERESEDPERQIQLHFLLFAACAAFDDFDGDNDPHHEHDFGKFFCEGEAFFFKIDYYEDHHCLMGSEWPDDPARSYRVMTIMYPSDY